MRVVSGIYKGRKLISPPDDAVRPTADRVKEALFSILQARVPDSAVLDLFAGSGALAIEAVSRGARSAVCVDRDTATVQKNIEALKCAAIEVVKADYAAGLKKLEAESAVFDIIFIDPPYRLSYDEILSRVTSSGIVRADTLIAVEHACQRPVRAPEGWHIVNFKKYGITALTILKGTER